ncbi:hypothetical protein WG906_04490 [Pedobacter sp. P351]|uniref:hypothetical protein n=1 Tax=Pedobacter superstes TaxID=3133441 RepID=UPI0030A14F37
MSKALITGFLFFLAAPAFAQQIKIPAVLSSEHPRLLVNAKTGKSNLEKLIADKEWAKNTFEKVKSTIDPYVRRHQTDPQWIVSRLQMYWKSKATDVYIKGGVYSHASGEAPVPTVRFTGTRDNQTIYAAPKLEDLQPYMDDTKGIYLINTTKPGRPMEWAEQSKSGRIIESINSQIMGMAQSAAFLYWYTGEEKYGKFAFDLFDTYMTGMYYRKEPIDLNHSHNQTLVGLTSFEVIHEGVLNELTGTYDFLHSYIEKNAKDKHGMYVETLKKWADIIIKNGVPFNNWNLFEARFVAIIALVLENDGNYADGRGSHYYLNEIFNKNAIRQWSLPKLINYGYDMNTGFWNESPGYAFGVMKDFIEFVSLFDQVLNIDLLEQLPVLKKAVLVIPEYLFPNGYTVGFGDTYHSRLPLESAYKLVDNAQKNNKPEQEKMYTKFIKTMEALGGASSNGTHRVSGNFTSLFASEAVVLKQDIKAAKPGDFISSSFYAPNVSYVVQRSGLDPYYGLMISQAGSEGNHAHANGIAMELFGKGTVMGAEKGIGTSYFQPDYKEYYSQFPAHNTVVVDGISSYPEMRSNHGFDLKSGYPASGQKSVSIPTVTYSDVYFLEPETNADQRRLMSIVRIDSTAGYYVDIFRSRKKEGGDKRHDYFYHNLGQELILNDRQGKSLALAPTEKLAFADGDLFAYDYIYDKSSASTSNDFSAIFKLKLPGKEPLAMNMWMKGYPDREVFKVKTPPSKAVSRGLVADSIAKLPMPAVVVRQSGEAWTRPFVAIYEPTDKAGSSIKSIASFAIENTSEVGVGLLVEHNSGNKDYLFSSAEMTKMIYADLKVLGTFGLIRVTEQGVQQLFLGNGTEIECGAYTIRSITPTTVSLTINGNSLSFTSDKPVIFAIPDNYRSVKEISLVGENGDLVVKGKRNKRNDTVVFSLPPMKLDSLIIKSR